ncbi:hypothetical protein [Variovorax sp. WS11]|uniref:hypothetical protein n=1 Tax=Variovorax sp. WS11 TaxID=1105204 RepID=UPI0013D920AA|nr:hypothetical protein [Variovorax sp. WS11]NDZ11520.1 hypothetical protein [Variovorax sp. WS11]
MNGALFPNVERRDSGPASQDRTSEEWFENSVESTEARDCDDLTDDMVDAADSMFGVAA